LPDPSDVWIWVATLSVAVVGGGALSLRWLRVARMVEDTPTSRIRSAAQGYVEIAGRCRPLQGTENLSPLTRRPCVWWRYRIQKKVESGTTGRRRQNWSTVQSGCSALPFLLDDGTGECIVQPAGAEVLTDESTAWYGATPWPVEAAGASLMRFEERRYRYYEERIYEHEQLCVLGEFGSHTAAAADDRDAAVAALLAEWKSDQAALADRFDADRDGRVSLAEWDAAREEARRTVDERDTERAPESALHTLARPGGGRLFLIAALPEGVVAKRYRRRALVAFAGFVAAAWALGWLLQRAIG
jgi:hypothetical protein